MCSPTTKTTLTNLCSAYMDEDDIYNYYDNCLYDITESGVVLACLQSAMYGFAKSCAFYASTLGNGTQISFPTSGNYSFTFGSGIVPVVFPSTTPITFYIQAIDLAGQYRSVGGDNFTVTSGPVPLDIDITDNQDGTYSVEYVPSVVGVYYILVQLNDQFGATLISNKTVNITSSAPFAITYGGLALTLQLPQTVVFAGIGAVANTSQSWQILYDTSAGLNRIISTAQPGLCLDINADGLTAGTRVIAYQCLSGHINQFWTIHTNGTIQSQLATSYFMVPNNNLLVTSYTSISFEIFSFVNYLGLSPFDR